MKWKRKGVMSSGWVQPRIHYQKLFNQQKWTFIVSKAERFLWESSCCCFTTFLRWPSEDKQNKFIVTFTRCTFTSNLANVCQVKVQPSYKHGTFWIYLNSIGLILHQWNSILYFDEHTGKTSLYGKMGTRCSLRECCQNLHKQCSCSALHEQVCIVLAAALWRAKLADWEILKLLQKQAAARLMWLFSY